MLDPEHVLTTTAAEPAYCTSCGLKHTRRPDWLCPRCGMPAGSEAPATHRARPTPRAVWKFPGGSRIAGAVMTAGGGALAVGLARFPGGEHRWPLLAAALVLGVLGVALALEASWARWSAAAAALVAAAIVAEDLLRERGPWSLHDPLPPAIRAPLRALLRAPRPAELFALALMAFLVACLLLLVGRPRTWRIAAGVLLAAPLVAGIVWSFAR
jgi:hypothetical protein